MSGNITTTELLDRAEKMLDGIEELVSVGKLVQPVNENRKLLAAIDAWKRDKAEMEAAEPTLATGVASVPLNPPSLYTTCKQCAEFLKTHPAPTSAGYLQTQRHFGGLHVTADGKRLHAQMLDSLKRIRSVL